MCFVWSHPYMHSRNSYIIFSEDCCSPTIAGTTTYSLSSPRGIILLRPRAHFAWPLSPGGMLNLKVSPHKTISRSLTQAKRKTAGQAAVLGVIKDAGKTTRRQIRAVTCKKFPGRLPRPVSTGGNKKYGTAGVSGGKKRKTVARRSSRLRSVQDLGDIIDQINIIQAHTP